MLEKGSVIEDGKLYVEENQLNVFLQGASAYLTITC